jgi:hypothetical protein
MRWPFPLFVLIALGGIVPLLSFFLEGPMTRRVKRSLEQLEAKKVPEVRS